MVTQMPWERLALAVLVALVAALAFFPTLRLRHRLQTAAWLGCSAVVGLSPCLIPLDAPSLRFVASLFTITLLVKLYDVHRESRLCLSLGFWVYMAYLPNGFWLVLRRKPDPPSIGHDFLSLGLRAPAALLLIVICVFLFQIDWSSSVALEYVLKVSAVVSAIVLATNAAAAGYRLVGGVASDFMGNPLIAPTPADFWRRWNIPAHQFLEEYAFKPAGGLRKPIRATLITFGISGIVHEYVFGIAAGRIQGWQFLFFIVQGVAVIATMRIRPKGRLVLLCVAATFVFNMASSVLFFVSVNRVVPFYSSPVQDHCAWLDHPDRSPSLPGGAEQNERRRAGCEVHRHSATPAGADDDIRVVPVGLGDLDCLEVLVRPGGIDDLVVVLGEEGRFHTTRD